MTSCGDSYPVFSLVSQHFDVIRKSLYKNGPVTTTKPKTDEFTTGEISVSHSRVCSSSSFSVEREHQHPCRCGWLECRPMHRKVSGLMPSRGTCLGFRFGPPSGRMQEAPTSVSPRSMFLSHFSLFLPPSRSPPRPPSLKENGAPAMHWSVCWARKTQVHKPWHFCPNGGHTHAETSAARTQLCVRNVLYFKNELGTT